jgi:hypothetical protein
MLHLSKQGILFAPIHLTTYSGRPNSHVDLGWEYFTTTMITQIAKWFEKQGKSILFCFVGREALKYALCVPQITHMKVSIDDPLETIDINNVSNMTKQWFIGMSNFVSEYYPQSAVQYQLSLIDAFNFELIDKMWLEYVVRNYIPMPALPEGISKKLKDSILDLSLRFDCPGTAGFVATPEIVYNVGINYLK